MILFLILLPLICAVYIQVLHNFPFTVVHGNVYLFVVPSKPISAIHSLMPSLVSFAFDMACPCQILRAFLPHYVSKKIKVVFLILNMFPFCFLRRLRAPSMVFSSSFCRTKFLPLIPCYMRIDIT